MNEWMNYPCESRRRLKQSDGCHRQIGISVVTAWNGDSTGRGRGIASPADCGTWKNIRSFVSVGPGHGSGCQLEILSRNSAQLSVTKHFRWKNNETFLTLIYLSWCCAEYRAEREQQKSKPGVVQRLKWCTFFLPVLFCHWRRAESTHGSGPRYYGRRRPFGNRQTQHTAQAVEAYHFYSMCGP